MADYKSTALAYARDRELTPEQVAEWDYRATATASKVVIDKDGGSPADFFWKSLQRYVWTVLAGERETFRREAIRAAMEMGAKTLEGDATVTLDGDKFSVSSIDDRKPPVLTTTVSS